MTTVCLPVPSNLRDIDPTDFDALTEWANRHPRVERSEAEQRLFERKVAEGFERARLIYHGKNRPSNGS